MLCKVLCKVLRNKAFSDYNNQPKNANPGSPLQILQFVLVDRTGFARRAAQAGSLFRL